MMAAYCFCACLVGRYTSFRRTSHAYIYAFYCTAWKMCIHQWNSAVVVKERYISRLLAVVGIDLFSFFPVQLYQKEKMGLP